METLWPADTMAVISAIFHHWMKECHTPKFLQVEITQCFCEAMATLLLAEITGTDNARFPVQRLEGTTFVNVCDKLAKDFLQLALLCEDDRIILTCSKLSGHEVFRFNADGTDLAWNAQKRIAGEMGVRPQKFSTHFA
jgi:hypothetical protein